MFTPVERDPSLPHQIVLLVVRDHIKVTCNCLCYRAANRAGMKGGGRPRYDHMPGEPRTYEEAKAIYDDPDNHNPYAVPPFGVQPPAAASEP